MLNNCNTVHAIVSAAGGELVGKTRLQKIAYILTAAGLSDSLHFRYHYYGPYSDDLTFETEEAIFEGMISTEDKPTSWGGHFTVFKTEAPCDVDVLTRKIVHTACAYDPITLELAATAAFLRKDFSDSYWDETAKRKPQKATPDRLEKARKLWSQLLEVETPRRLEAI
jgi:hypothetical protein